MTRIMRDSTTAADIPVAGTQLVMGYSNGAFAWSASDYARFPGIPHVYVDVLGNNPKGAGVVDVENGDVTVGGAPGWVKARLALEPPYLPIVYANRGTLTPLFNSLNAAGLFVARHFMLGIATLDGTRRVSDMTGVTFIQYAGQAQTGGHYDQSIVYDDSWHQS